MTKAVTPSELAEQQALRKRLYYTAPTVQIVAVPNAARRTQWEARRAKQEGLAAGFPDLMAIWPGGIGINFSTDMAVTVAWVRSSLGSLPSRSGNTCVFSV